ncbi:MAG: tRNA pseudouridine(54/55) synthase Pus10 [Candidatus Aenigmatarchaeota archaeon]|nr:MAG: tRNA pseudouridine(54/55) synthase Pus10 [Candidatus Aenigmarchaeota archaeon]
MQDRVLQKAVRILERPVCDHCLGRQFAQLLSGRTNVERGRAIRDAVAMALDSEENLKVDMSNFAGYRFHHSELKTPEARVACSACADVFEDVETYVKKVARVLTKLDFNTFLVGTQVSEELIGAEEELWERSGIEWCEPIKGELNREVGSRVEKVVKKKVDFKKPDVLVLLNLAKRRVSVEINPLCIYGEYNKLKRGIPQTKWPSGKYKISVEQIIAKPFMRATGGTNHKLHGMGREDIDARCLGWRPFILEILEPNKRNVRVAQLQKAANKDKRIRVRNMAFIDSSAIERLKRAQPDKSYRALVILNKTVAPARLKKLAVLNNKEIYQETPTRVMHRRADKVRRRVVKEVKWRRLGPRKIEIRVRAQAGTYIKELISGDGGRTYPSVSELLGVKARVKELDVIEIHGKKF